MKPLVFKIKKEDLIKQLNPWKREFTPVQLLVLSYLFIIFLGAYLLKQPFASATGQATGFVDAFFTSTSAVSVTGLVVKNTGTYWSPLGQMVILGLIQIGGLGYITIYTFFLLVFQHKVTLKHGVLLKEALNNPGIREMAKLAKHIFYFVVVFEGVGALILFLRFFNPFRWSSYSIMNFLHSSWMGIFHSISSFNNAGFSLFKTSFMDYVTDPIVNLTVTSLVIMGGIGFYVLSDLYEVKKGLKPRLKYHTKIAIVSTLFLLIVGTAMVFTLEHNNPLTLKPMSTSGKIMASYFQSVTARTAGFNTINTGYLGGATLLFLIALMFIGASPGGTGGGIKTTTATSLFYYVKSMLKRKNTVEIGHRRISYDVVNKAVTIFVISITFIFFMTVLINAIEPHHFDTVLFEVTSAYATVGLSTGITTELSQLSKVLISFTMFAGRVGVLSLILIFSMQLRRGKVLLPEEELTVG
jgi:trk system potassium uptake protein